MARTRIEPVNRLEISRRASQLELLEDDLKIESFRLMHNGATLMDIAPVIVGGRVERTIEGASTLTIDVDDSDRKVRNSRALGAEIDVELDELWFRLVRVDKSGNRITLTFEDREVAILRTYDKPKSVAWGKTTRQWFVWRMIKDVKEFKIPVHIEGLKEIQPVGGATTTKSKSQKAVDRDFGLTQSYVTPGGAAAGTRALLTIKGVGADSEQLNNCEIVLDVGNRMIPNAYARKRKIMVAAMMTIIQESTAHNYKGGDADSRGIFQQQKFINGKRTEWPASGDVATDSVGFYEAAMAYDAKNPRATYAELCQGVQKSAFPNAYAQWRTEGERLVTAYGIAGADAVNDNSAAALNLSGWSAVDDTDPQYTRGTPPTSEGEAWKKEDTWTCTGRLADEIHWRRFMVSGHFYFFSETGLFKSNPRAIINELSDGVDFIDWNYDIGEKNAQLTITCRIPRWEAPPGSVIQVNNEGPVSGRWLVTQIERDIFQTQGRVICKKPLPKLPEPTQEDLESPWGTPVPAQQGDVWAPLGDFAMPVSATSFSDQQNTYRNGDGPEGVDVPGGGNIHGGLDWFAPFGSSVYAPQNGKIIGITPNNNSGGQVFGGVVRVQNADGYVWVFRHVNPIGLKIGDRVEAGDKVAEIAYWSDAPSSSHVHIEVWKDPNGGHNSDNVIDPYKYIQNAAKGQPV